MQEETSDRPFSGHNVSIRGLAMTGDKPACRHLTGKHGKTVVPFSRNPITSSECDDKAPLCFSPTMGCYYIIIMLTAAVSPAK